MHGGGFTIHRVPLQQNVKKKSCEYHFYGLWLDQTGNRTRADILLVSLLHFWNDTRIRIVDGTDSSMFQNASGNNDTVRKLKLKCCPATFVKKPIMKNTAQSKGKEMEDWRYGADNTVI